MSEEAKKMNFTPEQKAAIDHRDTSLLVSAAAGSGKTRVLVERLLGYIDHGGNIDEFLIITYTRAAAYELKERISEGLYGRLGSGKKKAHYRRQVMLLGGALIDTIHTFCGDVLRENSHMVGLPPDFRVIDENESEILRGEVLSDVLDSEYDVKSKGVSDLLDMVIEGRDDTNLQEIVLDIYKKLQSLPSPQKWTVEQTEKLRNIKTNDITDTDCGRYIKDELVNFVDFCKNQMNSLRDSMTMNLELADKFGASVEVSYLGITRLLDCLNTSWDEACKNKNVEFPRTKPLKGHESEKAIRNWCKDKLRQKTGILEISSGEHILDLISTAPAMIALLELVTKFEESYKEEKKRKAVVDFSDLEHLTLSLLTDEENGKTQIAKSLSMRFTEIMVDEYQDVNEVQEMIFKSISRNEKNMFMVGDVKQSIYRFRLADPGIFLAKYDSFKEKQIEIDEKIQQEENVKIHLSRNFRSNSGILEVANYIFRNIMTIKLGEMEYTAQEALIPGREANKNQKLISLENKVAYGKIKALETPVEFDFISMKQEEQSNTEDNESGAANIKALDIEAKHIANRIVELIDCGYMIPDKELGQRKLTFKDIAILSRSQKGVASRIALALAKANIPNSFTTGQDFFETREIATTLALLSIIDNPMQDVELASSLSGPVYKFSAEELANIKSNNKSGSFYDAVIEMSKKDDLNNNLASKCKMFLEDIETFRAVSTDMTADRLIWYVYAKTGLIGTISSMSGGEQRKDNLILLIDLATRLEKSGYKGLFEFLAFVRKIAADSSGQDLAGKVAASDRNEVQIMTIHKSKGLEFPVVFLANTSKRINNLDSLKPIVFHKDLGVGSLLIDRKKRIKYSTLQREAIKSKQKSEMLSEELRVLYVALTRACEKLIVTGTYADAAAKFDKIQERIINKPAPEELKEMSCISDWIISGIKDINNEIAQINYWNFEEINEVELKYNDNCFADENDDIGLLKSYPPKYDDNYPHKSMVELPSKVTVTELKKLQDKEAQHAGWTKLYENDSSEYKRPSFIAETKKKSGAQAGTLVHHIMQYIDYEMCSSDPELRKALQLLVFNGVITEEEIESVDLSKIMRLFNSKLGKRLIKAKSLQREFKFSIMIPAEAYLNNAFEYNKTNDYSLWCKCSAKKVEDCICDKILLQGIIDCFFEENNEIILVDFKTDKVNSKTILERAKAYSPQLNLYANALERMINKKVKEQIIYFFEMDKAVIV